MDAKHMVGEILIPSDNDFLANESAKAGTLDKILTFFADANPHALARHCGFDFRCISPDG